MARLVCNQEFSDVERSGSQKAWSNSKVPTMDSLFGFEIYDETSEDEESCDGDSSELVSPRELIPIWPQLATADEMRLLNEVLDNNVELRGNELIFGIDADGLINEWSSKAMELTGCSKDNVIGHDFVNMFIISPKVQFPLHQVLEKALVGKETTGFEFPLYTSDSRWIQVLLTTVTRCNEEGEILGAFCIGKKRRADTNSNVPTMDSLPGFEVFYETLEDDESYDGDESLLGSPRELEPAWPQLATADEMSFLNEINENFELLGNELIFGIDADGLINEWGSKAMELLGSSREHVLRHDFVSIFIESPEVQMPLLQILEKALMGEETACFEFPMYTSDSRCVQVLSATMTRRNEDDEIIGAFFIGKEKLSRAVFHEQ